MVFGSILNTSTSADYDLLQLPFVLHGGAWILFVAQSTENVSPGWNKSIVVADSIHDGHYCTIMGGLQYVNVIDTDLNELLYAVFTDAIAMLCASPIMIIIDTTTRLWIPQSFDSE